MNFIGSNIKKFREQLQLSQRALSGRCNLSHTFINQIEKGKYKNIGSSSLLALSKVLQVKVDELLSEKET